MIGSVHGNRLQAIKFGRRKGSAATATGHTRFYGKGIRSRCFALRWQQQMPLSLATTSLPSVSLFRRIAIASLRRAATACEVLQHQPRRPIRWAQHTMRAVPRHLARALRVKPYRLAKTPTSRPAPTTALVNADPRGRNRCSVSGTVSKINVQCGQRF